MGAVQKPGVLRRSLGLIWRFVSFVERRLGIAGTLVIGLVLIVFGMVLNATIAGLLIGIPATLLGALLLLRALY